MKPKYKIGTLVTFANPAEQTGIIDGQIIRNAGNFYEIDGGSIIQETDILNAYRKVEKRVAKKRAVKFSNKKATVNPQVTA
jgi:hypothetical protein